MFRNAQPLKGRGALSNADGRYERFTHEAADDGWNAPDPEAEEAPRPKTVVMRDAAKSIIARNDSPDTGFDRSINPYRGCEHGCIYCYARPSHAWLGLSPGLDFERVLIAKHEAGPLLREALRKRGYRPETLAIGTNTDPYQPVETKLGLMRDILEVLVEARHPTSITTKSDRVVRDIDLLKELAAHRCIHVTISVTTLDGGVARAMEPRASAPAKRIAAIAALADAGVPVAVNVAPIVPGLTDHEMEAILEAAAGAGATSARFIPLRLPLEVKDLFQEWLRERYPDRARKVLSLVRGMRGGKLNVAAFGTRMKGEGAYADMIAARFAKACARLGLDKREEETWLATDAFRPPAAPPDSQLSLDF